MTLQFILLLVGLTAFISLFQGILKGICDSIAHHDSYASFGDFWSQKAYHLAKYYFLADHPYWRQTPFRIWFVKNVLVMFLDAWHLAQLLIQLLDHLTFILPFGILLLATYGATTFLIMGGALVILFIAFQIGFRFFYQTNKPKP